MPASPVERPHMFAVIGRILQPQDRRRRIERRRNAERAFEIATERFSCNLRNRRGFSRQLLRALLFEFRSVRNSVESIGPILGGLLVRDFCL